MPPGVPERADLDVELTDGTLRQAVSDLEEGQDTDAEVDVDGERIRVEILHHTTDAAIRRLVRRLGGTIDGAVPGVLAEGEVPFDRLEELEAVPAVDVVRPPLLVNEPTGLPGSGAFVGEDVARTNAEDWQAAGLTGTGVKVGIIDSFALSDWNAAQAAGEVPAPAGIFCQFGGSNACTVYDDNVNHGVAVAEIVHDMAPDAQLYLAAVDTTADTQAAVDYFDSQGVHIITRSLTSPYDGPGNGTGPLATVINNAVADGMAWFNSAGNSAGQDGVRFGSYYRGVFRDTNGDTYHEFNPPGDPLDQALGFNCGFQNGLRWDDFGEGAGTTDYDMIVTNTANTVVVDQSIDDQAAGAPPIERTELCASGGGLIFIKRFAPGTSSAGDILEFGINGTGIEYWQNPGSASGPAADTNSNGALVVGAMEPVGGTTIAVYSSRGPTNDNRIKPDLSAGTCVSSFSFDPDCFNGTSGATPTVAGGAALLLDAGLASTPQNLRSWILARATVDRGAAGADNTFGKGEFILPTSLPDARIRTGTTGPIKGDNVYNANGANQSVTRSGGANSVQTFTATIQNDLALPGRYKLRGTRSTTKFTVAYRRGDTNAVITPAVGNGTFLTPVLNPGQTFTVKISVTVRPNTVRNNQLNGLLTATSNTDASRKDAVAFVTRRA